MPSSSYLLLLAAGISVVFGQSTSTTNSSSATTSITSDLSSSASKVITSAQSSVTGTTSETSSDGQITTSRTTGTKTGTTTQDSSTTVVSVPSAYIIAESCSGGSSCTNETFTAPLGYNMTFGDTEASTLYVKQSTTNGSAVYCTFAAGNNKTQHSLTFGNPVNLSTNLIKIDWLKCVASSDCTRACVTSTSGGGSANSTSPTPTGTMTSSTISTSITSSMSSASTTANGTVQNAASGLAVHEKLLPVVLVGAGLACVL